MKFKSFVTKPCVLIVLSAVFSALPLTFSQLFFLSWISFIPLFCIFIKHSGDKLRLAFGRGFLFGFIYHVCIYYWFCWFYPLDYAGLNEVSSIAVVVLAVFGISIAHGALWCIPFICCFIARKVCKNAYFISFVAIVSIIGAQKITLISDLSFPWVRLSLGQYNATSLIQSASLFGVDGVDMIILAVNALLTICIVSPPMKKRIFAVLCATVIFVANLGFGIARINTATHKDEFTVMTVQASVENDKKWSGNGDTICYAAYSALTKDNFTADVDIILWPESAVPTVYRSYNSLSQYKKLSAELDAPILAGILLKSNGQYTNNATLITKDGVAANYSKRHLVPFGEYVPYEQTISKIFPFLSDINILSDDYIAGDSSEIITINEGKVGNIICFESIYPELSRRSVLDGAEILIETTNDSWLKDSPAMTQHLAHGVFRSVENGRYLVRSANSGISATIDSRGRIIKTLDIDQKGVITDTVYFCDETTLYTKTGDILFPVCVTILCILFTILLIKKLINKNNAES